MIVENGLNSCMEFPFGNLYIIIIVAWPPSIAKFKVSIRLVLRASEHLLEHGCPALGVIT